MKDAIAAHTSATVADNASRCMAGSALPTVSRATTGMSLCARCRPPRKVAPRSLAGGVETHHEDSDHLGERRGRHGDRNGGAVGAQVADSSQGAIHPLRPGRKGAEHVGERANCSTK